MRNIAFACLCGTLGLAAAASANAATGLDALRWNHRVIVVFTPTHRGGADARDTLANTGGVDERDIAWFVVAPERIASNSDIEIDGPTLRPLHRTDGFEAVLIGKDGGVKARQTEALDLSALFERIDSMPMRRREMNARP